MRITLVRLRIIALLAMSHLVALPAARAANLRVVGVDGQLIGIDGVTKLDAFFGAAFDTENHVVVRTLPSGLWVENLEGSSSALVSGAHAPGFPAGVNLELLYKGSPVQSRGLAASVGYVRGGPYPATLQVAFGYAPGVGFRTTTFAGQTIPGGFVVTALDTVAEALANRAGDVLTRGFLSGGPIGAGSAAAAWIGSNNGPQLVVYEGMPAPGVPDEPFTDLGSVSSEFALNDSGNVAFLGRAGGFQGVWLLDPTTPANHRLIKRAGIDSQGVVVNGLQGVQAANGRVVFSGSVADPGQPTNQATFSDIGGITEIVARTGQNAPGLGPNAKFTTVRLNGASELTMNSLGDIAFAGAASDPSLPGGSTTGVWVDSPTRPLELAIRASDLPGVGTPRFDNLVMNNAGQMAFTLSDGASLWFFDPVMGPQRIFAAGDQFPIVVGGQAVTKTIARIDVGGFPTALPTAQYLSEQGRVVFVARFTDRTIAIAEWAAVPEPASAAAIIAPLLVCHRVARRGRRTTPCTA